MSRQVEDISGEKHARERLAYQAFHDSLNGLACLARGLGILAIAEGVETAEQAQILLSQGWTHGQGYHLGRPQPLA